MCLNSEREGAAVVTPLEKTTRSKKERRGPKPLRWRSQLQAKPRGGGASHSAREINTKPGGKRGDRSQSAGEASSKREPEGGGCGSHSAGEANTKRGSTIAPLVGHHWERGRCQPPLRRNHYECGCRGRGSNPPGHAAADATPVARGEAKASPS